MNVIDVIFTGRLVGPVCLYTEQIDENLFVDMIFHFAQRFRFIQISISSFQCQSVYHSRFFNVSNSCFVLLFWLCRFFVSRSTVFLVFVIVIVSMTKKILKIKIHKCRLSKLDTHCFYISHTHHFEQNEFSTNSRRKQFFVCRA